VGILIVLIIVLACILAFVPSIPTIGRTFLMIAIAVCCAIILLDVLGIGLGGFGGNSTLFHSRC